MADYFVEQTNLIIELETFIDLSDAVLLIKYRKPDGKTGQWNATKNSTDNTKMYYDLVAGDLDQAGNWTFWAYATFAANSIGIGKATVKKIKTEGQVT
jgi:hypothetical protein